MFPEVRNYMMFQSSGVEAPASGCWSPFYSSIRIHLKEIGLSFLVSLVL